jgi:hypothetical protein
MLPLKSVPVDQLERIGPKSRGLDEPSVYKIGAVNSPI